MIEKLRKFSLATWIFIGLVAGIFCGLIFISNPDFATKFIKPFGDLYLNLIRFIVAPIVLFSIVGGVISLRDVRKIGSIGSKSIVYYMVTTVFAIVLGLFVATLFKGFFTVLDTSQLSFNVAESPSIIETIIKMFPSNAVAPFVESNMLQIIVIALFVGFGIIFAGEKGKFTADMVESLTEVFLKIMMFIIKLSPIGVFCLITPVVAVNGPSVLGSLSLVLIAAYLAYILHLVIVYFSLVRYLGKMSPIKFLKGMMPAMMFAFSSASSIGTLPLNIECCEKLGANKDVVRFTLPLGATINMDGTAIYQSVAAIFIASCFGIDLSLQQMGTIVVSTTLASIGTAGVPGSSMIMLAMVLESVGLPIAGIALVAGIDRLFDMGRTVLNITGDATCGIIVSKLEEKKR